MKPDRGIPAAGSGLYRPRNAQASDRKKVGAGATALRAIPAITARPPRRQTTGLTVG